MAEDDILEAEAAIGDISDIIAAADSGDHDAQYFCLQHPGYFALLRGETREEIIRDLAASGHEDLAAAAKELHLSIAKFKKKIGVTTIKPKEKSATPERHFTLEIGKHPNEFEKPRQIARPGVVNSTVQKLDKKDPRREGAEDLHKYLNHPEPLIQHEKQDAHDIMDRHPEPIIAPTPAEELNQAIHDVDQMVQAVPDLHHHVPPADPHHPAAHHDGKDEFVPPQTQPHAHPHPHTPEEE